VSRDTKPMRKYGCRMWALTNMGILLMTFRTRRQAIEYAESGGLTWDELTYLEVRKVTIIEGWS
jgi:hypothetical protein